MFALNVLQERGISVPQQCSIVGYDNIYLAASTVPSLTTIEVDRPLMARQAVTNLIERIAVSSLSPRHTSVAVTLVKRRSAMAR